MTKEIAIREKVSLSGALGKVILSDESLKTYKYALNSYLKYCKKTDSAQGMDSMLAFLRSLENPDTQAVYAAALKKILREFYRDDPRLPDLERELSKIKRVSRDKSISRSSYLIESEVNKLASNCPENIALIIRVLFWTGSRISEALRIELKNCIIQKDFVEIKVIGKRRKENTIYMGRKLFSDCKKFFNGERYLIEHKGKQYSREFITGEISKYGKSVLSKKISAHTFRHSKAMYLKDVMKLSVDQVQRALNHSNPTTTIEHYFHGKPDAEKQGIK